MGNFAAATAVHPTDDRGLGAEIVPGWDILGNANGGYLMAILGRAALHASGRPDVVALSAEFLSPGRSGSVRLTTSPLKQGRRFDTTRVDMIGDDRLIQTGTVISGDLDAASGATLVLAERPEIPAPDQCIVIEPNEPFPPAFAGQVDMRLHPADAFTAADPTTATVRGWFRLHDDEPLDSLAVVMACDGFPPTVFNTELDVGWVPTVQMTVHVRSRPVGEWLQIQMTTSYITNGMFEADAVAWDDSGTLVAQSRQLALVPQA